MKEVRTFVGIAREQVNALFGVVATMEEMLSPKGKTTLPDNNHWYCLQAHVLNGDPCFALLKNGSICTKLLEIEKAQLQRDGKWVVQLVIEGAQRYSDVSYGSSPKEIGDAWNSSGRCAARGMLLIRPAISSWIDMALGLDCRVEPLYIVPSA